MRQRQRRQRLAFCTKCGLDLQKYREQWSDSPGGPSDPASGQQADPAQQPVAAPSAYPPPYQQQYQPTYQAPPPYQEAPGYQQGPATSPPAAAYQPAGYTAGLWLRDHPQHPSYMGWAIATLILCFWPTGIVAVVYASKVGTGWRSGTYAGAQDSSHKAKVWLLGHVRHRHSLDSDRRSTGPHPRRGRGHRPPARHPQHPPGTPATHHPSRVPK